MSHKLVSLNTTGKIARICCADRHRVEYVIRSCPDIRPTALAGRTRLYNAAALARIRYELNRIDAARKAGRGASR